jgi:hypothetical protein
MDPSEIPSEWCQRSQRYSLLFSALRHYSSRQWGFVIIRTTYDDDEAWASYLQCVRDNAHIDLTRFKPERGAVLEQMLTWTVIEDAATLANASREHVRQRFQQWRQEQDDFNASLPRFTYCVNVTRACLDTLGAHVANKPDDVSTPHLPPPSLVAEIVDGDFAPGPEGESGGVYLGWEYVDTRYLMSTYNTLHGTRLDGYDYQRPPAIAPLGRQTMPLA